jgi:hypothetical protein
VKVITGMVGMVNASRSPPADRDERQFDGYSYLKDHLP